MGLVEERETRYRVDTLLARLMDNIPVLATSADTPAPSQSHKAGAQAPAEAAHAKPTLGRAPRALRAALSARCSGRRSDWTRDTGVTFRRI
jgi:hypothetical protein